MTAEPTRPPTVWSAAHSPSFWRSSAPGRSVTHVLLTGLALTLGSMPAAVVAAPVVDLVDAVQDRSPISVAARLLLLLVLAVLVLPLTALLQARFDVARARLVDRRLLGPVVESPVARTRWAQRWTQPASWLRVLHLLLVWVVVGPLLMVLLMLLVTGLVLVAAPVLVSFGAEAISLGPWEIRTFAAALPLVVPGLLLVAATPYLCAALATAQVAVARRLLCDPSETLARDLVELRSSRERLVHDFDAERRRIERDLHDGAQQQLVSLTMRLGLARREAERELGSEHQVARELQDAHQQAKQLMGDLRTFIRGIHPKALSDVGLAAALDQLTSSLPLPVEARVEGERLPSHLESTLYFSITEALTNVVKHSGAQHASVHVRRERDQVLVDVVDDGCGGADPARGTGLRGIADRVAVVEGTLAVSSPEGGPTLVRISAPLPAG